MMKKRGMKIGDQYIVLQLSLLILLLVLPGHTQDIRWLRIGELQSPYNEVGAEYETEFNLAGTTSNYFSWPSQYSIDQTVTRMKGLWIGCTNYDDFVEGQLKSVKVVGTGPKSNALPDQIFPQEIRLIGRYPHPNVTAEGVRATVLDNYDILDEIDENLPCDRMVLIRYHTSIGVSVTKKVMAFAQPEHGNYFINDYVFKNTGIIDGEGTVHEQTLNDFWVYFFYRYAFGGLTSSGSFLDVWGGFNSLWGESTLNHAFGEDPNALEFTDPNSPFYQMRGFYSWYGPYDKSPRPPYDEDWGCPKLDDPWAGTLGTAKYTGCVTLHADTGPQDQSDNPYQPATTWFLSPDADICANTNPSQYDEIFMNDRWTAITEGHPSEQHDEVVGDDYPNNYRDPRRNLGGGVGMGQGFGPYILAPGDSIHIVFAEGVSGISWEKGREIGRNWLQWRNGTGQPTLIMPDGMEEDSDYNEYKRAWVVDAGRDSLLKTMRNAMENFNSGYTLPEPPPPPGEFTVLGGGDRVQLTWADNAIEHPHFGGYVIYRSEGDVLDWTTVYEKIFETDDPSVTHFDDTTARRGFDYFYYIQSKDDGTQIPGKTLFSSLFWTVTSVGAVLGRPAGTELEQVRVVPNPYDIRARLYQFGEQSMYDRIAFYGLPPQCTLKIFTERGDLIWEKEHTRSTGDEIWDSTTSSGQIISSGVYILYVETPDGRSVYRKFVVIR